MAVKTLFSLQINDKFRVQTKRSMLACLIVGMFCSSGFALNLMGPPNAELEKLEAIQKENWLTTFGRMFKWLLGQN